MVIHYKDYKTLQNAPSYIKAEYYRDGVDGALCGYVGIVTMNKQEVTCVRCNKLIKESKSWLRKIQKT